MSMEVHKVEVSLSYCAHAQQFELALAAYLELMTVHVKEVEVVWSLEPKLVFVHAQEAEKLTSSSLELKLAHGQLMELISAHALQGKLDLLVPHFCSCFLIDRNDWGQDGPNLLHWYPKSQVQLYACADAKSSLTSRQLYQCKCMVAVKSHP